MTAIIRNNVGYYAKAIVCVFIMFGFGQLPPIEPITPLGMNVLGIFLGLLFGWSVIGLIWPSIMGTLALVLLCDMSLASVLAAGWGSVTLLLIFFMILVSGIVEQTGVSRFIAVYIITRTWVLKNPWIFVYAFFLAVFILSSITSTIAAIIICWSILYSVCQIVGYKPYEAFSSFMVVGVVFAATIGLAMFPFRTVGIMVFGILEKISGLTVNYMTYIMFTIPMSLLCILLFCLIGKFVFKVDVSLLKQLNKNSFANENLVPTRRQKAVLIFVAILVMLLLLPSILPKTFFLCIILNKIQATGTAMLLIVVMCCLKIDGEPLMNIKTVCSKGMQWDVIFLTSVVMPLASAITSEDAGITDLMLKVFTPIFEGRSAISFMAIAVLTAVILTNFANNQVVGAILLPVFYPFALLLGVSPMVITVLLVFSCHFALLTPAASPMAALLHGNTDWCRSKEIYKYGFISLFISIVAIIIIGLPYALVLF